MELIRESSKLKQFLHEKRRQKLSIGFVPTMGALHEGHLSLIRQSASENDCTVVSIFVNPTQFNESKDFANYPRQEGQDLEMLGGVRVDAVFMPETTDMYAAGHSMLEMDLEGLDDVMEGAFRPDHFKGVITVVDKFFDLVQPDAAYFGLKDYQQLAIIRFMAGKRHPNIRIVPCPILRENGGLAMSSRNALLSAEQRKEAEVIYRILSALKQQWKSRPFVQLREDARQAFSDTSLQLEYLEIADAVRLELLSDYSGKAAVACVAARIGGVRLIDNIVLEA
jgi:pantoate--beta-alanine ligase